MSKSLDEGYLYAHIPAAESAVLRTLPEEEHIFSRRFQRKMDALLKYERRTPLGRIAARTGQIAAAVLAAVILLNAALVGSVKAYREAFFEIAKTVTKEFTSFFVKTDPTVPTADFAPIEPPYIPEGYTEVERFSNIVVHTILYQNANGNSISFSQNALGKGVVQIDTEHAKVKVLQIHDHEVYVITENEMVQVFCTVSDSELMIAGTASYTEILKMAESLLKFFEK